MAPLRERLAQVARLLPPGSAVLLPVESFLADEECSNGSQDWLADFTVNRVASELSRSPSTVREWCRAGKIPEAYRLNGREWRIPRSGLQKYLNRQDGSGPRSPRRHREIDLSAWRREST